jgi:hydrogenase maturation protease
VNKALRATVIGIGNAFRSDDAAGIIAARQLAESAGPAITVLENADLLEAFKTSAHIVLVDAVRSGAGPGSIVRIDASEHSLPHELFGSSTHALGLAHDVELARTLGQLPERLIVYGIEGSNFAPGTTLSPEVERAIPELVHRIADDIRVPP